MSQWLYMSDPCPEHVVYGAPIRKWMECARYRDCWRHGRVDGEQLQSKKTFTTIVNIGGYIDEGKASWKEVLVRAIPFQSIPGSCPDWAAWFNVASGQPAAPRTVRQTEVNARAKA